MRFLAKPLGYLLSLIYNLIGSYGLAIVILTLVVKFILYPFYVKQIKSTANMSSIQPKMKAIQNKYANDKEMMNQKMQELYKEENYSPTAGCLPMIIQMIVIFGLFALVRNPISYLGDSQEMLFAVHQSFLWITDLSQPDKWILPIAAGVATFISFTMSQKNGSMTEMGTTPGMGSAQGMSRAMKYIFPVMIVLMARSYPAALAIYWFFGQVIQIGFNFRFNQIRKNMSKGGKKK